MLECAVFGRLAGANAAEKALKETEFYVTPPTIGSMVEKDKSKWNKKTSEMQKTFFCKMMLKFTQMVFSVLQIVFFVGFFRIHTPGSTNIAGWEIHHCYVSLPEGISLCKICRYSFC